MNHVGSLSISECDIVSTDGDNRSVGGIAFRFLLHVALATIASSIVGTLLLKVIALKIVGPHFFLKTFLLDVPYSPAFWGIALLIGYLVNRRMRDRYAVQVGPTAVLLLVLLIILSYPGYRHSSHELSAPKHSFARYVYRTLFSLDSTFSSDGGLGKLMFTMPVLNCIAYSCGSWLSLRRSSENAGFAGR
jgi:hypothetical protein